MSEQAQREDVKKLAALQREIDMMRRASAVIDIAKGSTDYTVGCVSLAVVTRAFLRKLDDLPDTARLTQETDALREALEEMAEEGNALASNPNRRTAERGDFLLAWHSSLAAALSAKSHEGK